MVILLHNQEICKFKYQNCIGKLGNGIMKTHILQVEV